MCQMDGFHQIHILLVLFHKISCYGWAIPIMPNKMFIFIPAIYKRILSFFFPFQPSVCQAEDAAPRIKFFGIVIFMISSCFLDPIIFHTICYFYKWQIDQNRNNNTNKLRNNCTDISCCCQISIDDRRHWPRDHYNCFRRKS